MGWESEFAEVLEMYDQGVPVPTIADKKGMMIKEVFAILLTKYEQEELTIDAKLVKYFNEAVKEKDKLIAVMKADFGEEFSTGAEIQENAEQESVKEDTKEPEKKPEQIKTATEEEFLGKDGSAYLDLLTEIRRLEAKFDKVMMAIKEMQDNIGYSKYGSIKRYIQIHDTISVDNLTQIFGTYARNVLYRLVNDGYVEKVARGIYKYKGGVKNENKKE